MYGFFDGPISGPADRRPRLRGRMITGEPRIYDQDLSSGSEFVADGFRGGETPEPNAAQAPETVSARVPDDVSLAERVRVAVHDALREAPREGRSLSIGVAAGRVRLSGFLEDARLRRRVAETVRRVPGVRVVDNQLFWPNY